MLVKSKIIKKLILEAIVYARKVQDYIWQELTYEKDKEVDLDFWVRVFQRCVDRIRAIDSKYSNAKVELRKRLLQQAALSIVSMKILDRGSEIKKR
ncbi:MAG TPA: hypothetical protein ENH82_02590 [bacterium]|nr:hypothetical protein [bacterium]